MQKLPGTPRPQTFEPLPPKIHLPVPLYDANFSHDSLNPDVDNLGIGALQFGHSELNNNEPTYKLRHKELVLSVRLPATLPTIGEITPLAAAAAAELTLSAVTAGVFATPLPSGFDRTVPFTIQGTFVAPSGPPNGTWAVGILARNGGVADLTTNTQVVATLQFNAMSTATARLNVPKGATNHTPVPLPTQLMDAILGQDPFGDRPASPIPFILGLSVDRISGYGTAFLIVQDQTFSISSFQLKDFQENSELEISAVGTVIANATATDETVSVHVRDFQIYSTESAS